VQFARLDDPPLNQSESFTTSVAAPKQVEATRSEAAPPGEEPDRQQCAQVHVATYERNHPPKIRLRGQISNEEDIDLLLCLFGVSKEKPNQVVAQNAPRKHIPVESIWWPLPPNPYRPSKSFSIRSRSIGHPRLIPCPSFFSHAAHPHPAASSPPASSDD